MGTPMSKDSDDEYEYEYDDSEDFDEEIERDVPPKYDSQCSPGPLSSTSGADSKCVCRSRQEVRALHLLQTHQVRPRRPCLPSLPRQA